MTKSHEVIFVYPYKGLQCHCTHIDDVSIRQFACHCPIFIKYRTLPGLRSILDAKYEYKHIHRHTVRFGEYNTPLTKNKLEQIEAFEKEIKKSAKTCPYRANGTELKHFFWSQLEDMRRI